MNVHETYMQKAINLAIKGRGNVSPNPLVGCVVVKNGSIIGEGYHKKFGDSHAEVDALNNCIEDPSGGSIYVTLEPCNHYGKTPPCTDYIIKSGIRDVYISQLDPNPKMSGKSIELLKSAGINVEHDFLVNKTKIINRFYSKWIINKVPYVIGKIAQDSRGYIAKKKSSIWITNEKSKKNVHKMRSKVDAIMIGKNTAIIDNPELTVREIIGNSPKRIILDTNRTLPLNLKVFKDKKSKTIVVCSNKLFNDSNTSSCEYISVNEKNGKLDLHHLLNRLGELGITSLILEGGSELLNSFLIKNLIDEFHLYSSKNSLPKLDVKNPFIINSKWNLRNEEMLDDDTLVIFEKKEKCLQEL